MEKVVGNYIIYQPIGKGQFGQVHLAKKRLKEDNPEGKRDNQYFACKVIKLNKCKTNHELAEIQREVDILSSLNSSNIV